MSGTSNSSRSGLDGLPAKSEIAPLLPEKTKSKITRLFREASLFAAQHFFTFGPPPFT